jgi:hypothetical protein
MQVALNIIFAVWAGKGNANYPTGWKPIPPKAEGWASVFGLASKGGTKRGFLSSVTDFQPYPDKRASTISTQMEAGDEIRELLQRGSLTVWRRSDEFSTDFMAASSDIKRGCFLVSIQMHNDSGTETATIAIDYAKISSFQRAVKSGKNIELISVSFESKNARVKYGKISKQSLLGEAKSGS